MATNGTSNLTPADIIAQEARWRRPAAYTAMASALLTLLAVVIQSTALRGDVPTISANNLLQTLEAARTGAKMPASFASEYAGALSNDTGASILLWVASAFSTLLLAPALVLLVTAVRNRGGTSPKFFPHLIVAGVILFAGSQFVLKGILDTQVINDAKNAGLLPGDIRDASEAHAGLVPNLTLMIGSLLIAVPLGIAGVNSARLGLLPKLVGYLGGLVAVLFVIGALNPADLIRALWISVLAIVLRGGAFESSAPAWAAGEAVLAAPRQPAKKPAAGDKPKK